MFENLVPEGDDLFVSLLQGKVHHHTQHASISLLQTSSKSKSKTR
jgi:hypothetical protein